MAALEAEQQLLVVREPHELEVDRALHEVEPRDRQDDRGDQGEEREDRMTMTVGQMNSHLADPSDLHAPSVVGARRGSLAET